MFSVHFVILDAVSQTKYCCSPEKTNIFPLLRSEIPSGICAKLRTVAATNNRVHMPWSLYYCLFAPHKCMVLFFTHIPFVVNHIIDATPPERLQHPPNLGWLRQWLKRTDLLLERDPGQLRTKTWKKMVNPDLESLHIHKIFIKM